MTLAIEEDVKININFVYYLFIWVLMLVSTHCIGHITMRSFMGGGNQYIQLVRFSTANCQPAGSKYQLSHLRSGWDSNSDLRGGRGECNHSATLAPRLCIRFGSGLNDSISSTYINL